MAVRFIHSMSSIVEDHAISGLTSNEELAQAICHELDGYPVTATDVARWRKQYPRFERACAFAVQETHAALTRIIVQSALDGNTADAKWFLERRNPAFMPKSKTEFGKVENLDDALSRRAALTERDLARKGIIDEPDAYDDDE